MADLDRTMDRFRDAWNRHDAGELAALWAEDGELHHPWGLHRVGREAIRELLASEHASSMAESELSVERIECGPASDTVAVEIDAVLKGVRAPNGRPYDLPTVMSALFVRAGDDWQIRSLTPLANPRHRDV